MIIELVGLALAITVLVDGIGGWVGALAVTVIVVEALAFVLTFVLTLFAGPDNTK